MHRRELSKTDATGSLAVAGGFAVPRPAHAEDSAGDSRMSDLVPPASAAPLSVLRDVMRA
jgi:hypothetical protein